MLQHRLSKFYLRGFAKRGQKRTLYEYVKGKGFAGEVDPESASAEHDAFVVDEPSNPNIVEEFFQGVETRASKVFARVRQQMGLSPTDQLALARFVALTFVRSSRRVAESVRVQTLLDVEAVEQYFRDPGTKIEFMLNTPGLSSVGYDQLIIEYIASLRSGMQAMPKLPRNHHLSLIPNAMTHWTDGLMRMRWRFVRAPPGCFFVVGDEPLVVRRRGRLFDDAYVGLARADLDIEASIPINRTVSLVLDWDGPPSIAYEAASRDRVHALNLRSVMGAHSVFLSPERNEPCEDYVRQIGERGIKVVIPSTLQEFLSWDPGPAYPQGEWPRAQ